MLDRKHLFEDHEAGILLRHAEETYRHVLILLPVAGDDVVPLGL